MATEWLAVPAAYLIGSLQWGLLLVRLTHHVDVRDVGSGKTGVTNVLRAAGKGAAALVLVLDAGKGLGAVLLGSAVSDGDAGVKAAAAAAVMGGHVFPIFAGFRGGRGVATGLGAAGGLLPWSAAVGVAVFAPTAAATRYASFASVLAVTVVAASFVGAWVFADLPLPHLWFALACGPLVVWMHRDNIRRLRRGTERRIGERAE